jgi:hypothetical protein
VDPVLESYVTEARRDPATFGAANHPTEAPTVRDPASDRKPSGSAAITPPSGTQAFAPSRLTVHSPAGYWPQVCGASARRSNAR